MIARLIPVIRLMLGIVYVVNGANWFFKIITPYPSISDFVHFMPPPDIVGALIENGILFHLAKLIELATGLALIAGRFVPLSLVVAMTVTVPVFVTDVFRPEFRLRAFLMGSGSLVTNVTLLLAYLDHYRPMLAWRAAPSDDPALPSHPHGGDVAALAGRIGRPILLVLVPVAAALGAVMVGWLGLMIVQHAAHPQSLNDLRPLVPRDAGSPH